MTLKRTLAAIALLGLPTLALAHTGDGALHEHGVLAGFLHPLAGPDHLAAMLAVGLWSALVQKKGAPLLAAPLCFAALLLLGALAGMAGWASPLAEPLVAASVLVLGLLVAMRLRLGAGASGALVGAFAVFHGLSHGTELQGAGALAGMLAATVLLHLAGIALGLKLSARAARGAGVGIAMLGAVLVFG